MMKNVTKISVVCLLTVAGLNTAFAVPSVRKLGGANTYPGTTSASISNSGANKGSARVASFRSGNGIYANTLKSSDANASKARLSLGKLLHNSGVSKGVIKPASQNSGTTPTDTSISGSDLTSLQDRLHAVETNISTMTNRVQEARDHMLDVDVHVSASDRNNWNAKQDALTAGSGISIENGVISSTVSGGGSGSNVSDAEKATWNAKQDALTAGSGITIENNVISSSHTPDVTAEEKATWNAKQNALTAGSGITIENGVVSVDTSILPTDTSDAVSGLDSRVSATESHVANTDIHVSANEKATWNAKQNALTAGSGITIENGVISSTHTPDVTAEEKATWNAKQDALTAGSGIAIENGVVSSNIDTSLSLSDTESASGKMVSGVSVNDRTINVQRSNVKIPVGSENANPTATIWIE